MHFTLVSCNSTIKGRVATNCPLLSCCQVNCYNCYICFLQIHNFYYSSLNGHSFECDIFSRSTDILFIVDIYLPLVRCPDDSEQNVILLIITFAKLKLISPFSHV